MNKNHLFCKLCIGIGLLGFVACSDCLLYTSDAADEL